MSSFVLNLSQTRDNISSSKYNLKNYEENINLYLSSVLNIDSAWNDNNTIGFIDTVKKDRLHLNEQITALSKYLNIIDSFCSSLNNIIINNFNIGNLNSIKYDLDDLNQIINSINKIYNLISNNYELLNNLKVPLDFKYYKELKQLAADYLVYKRNVNNFRIKLSNIKKEIESLISHTKTSVAKFEVKYISNNICEHHYKVSSAILKDVEVNNKNYETNAINATIAVNVNNIAYKSEIDNKNSNGIVFNQELKEDNLKFGVDEHNPLNNKISVELLNDNLEENKDIRQSLGQLKEETLQEDSLNLLEEQKFAQENKYNNNLENTNINSNINNVEASNDIMDSNLKTTTISSINSVNAESNIRETNLNNISVGTINSVSNTNNIVDANLENS